MVFFANHGQSDEEQKVGNKYEVTVVLETELEQAAETDKIEDTINYEAIYQIVKETMEKPQRLLETLVNNIIDDVYFSFPDVLSCEVLVTKYNPPVGGVCHSAMVSNKR